MTWDEIKANHRDDIKRQAIMFYKSKNVFDGERRKNVAARETDQKLQRDMKEAEANAREYMERYND